MKQLNEKKQSSGGTIIWSIVMVICSMLACGTSRSVEQQESRSLEQRVELHTVNEEARQWDLLTLHRKQYDTLTGLLRDEMITTAGRMFDYRKQQRDTVHIVKHDTVIVEKVVQKPAPLTSVWRGDQMHHKPWHQRWQRLIFLPLLLVVTYVIIRRVNRRRH